MVMSLQLAGQATFKYQAKIDNTTKAGFYKVYLQPALVAKCRSDLADLRIVNNNGDFIPYVIATKFPRSSSDFVQFPSVDSIWEKDTLPSFVIGNKGRLPITSLWLQFKNAAVRRQIDLLGSDDLKNWYAIREGIPILEASSRQDDTYQQEISFPLSTYRYFKLIITDENKVPINFIKAGIYAGKAEPLKLFKLPSPRIIQKDSSDKISYI
jgi:hypothetical protein